MGLLWLRNALDLHSGGSLLLLFCLLFCCAAKAPPLGPLALRPPINHHSTVRASLRVSPGLSFFVCSLIVLINFTNRISAATTCDIPEDLVYPGLGDNRRWFLAGDFLSQQVTLLPSLVSLSFLWVQMVIRPHRTLFFLVLRQTCRISGLGTNSRTSALTMSGQEGPTPNRRLGWLAFRTTCRREERLDHAQARISSGLSHSFPLNLLESRGLEESRVRSRLRLTRSSTKVSPQNLMVF